MKIKVKIIRNKKKKYDEDTLFYICILKCKIEISDANNKPCLFSREMSSCKIL